MDKFIESLSRATFPVLFLGSGFSNNANNIEGNKIPTGRGLNELLHSELGLNPKYELDIISREYIRVKGEYGLYNLLQRILVCNNTPKFINSIINRKWKRIYTTNFDNVISKALSAEKADYLSYSCLIDDSAKINREKLSAIYINGILPSNNFEEFDSNIRLTRASYLTDSFINSPWYWLFKTDISLSSCIVIIGYSMYDIDIARILYQDPTLKSRIFFIEPVDLDPVFARELEQYGSVLSIGVEGLARIIEQYFETDKGNGVLTAFSEFSFENTSVLPTATSVLELFLFGDYDHKLKEGQIISGKGYTVQRKIEREILERIRKGANSVFLHSDLGNGKTVVIENLKHLLKKEEYNIFEPTISDELLARDLESIQARGGKIAIIIDDAFRDSEKVRKIRISASNILIIASSRSSIFELRPHRLDEMFGSDYIIFDVNQLHEDDILPFSDTLNENGLWAGLSARNDADKAYFIRNTCKMEIRNIILHLFESPALKERIVEMFGRDPDGDKLRIITTAMLLEIANFTPDLMLVGQLTGVDVFAHREKLNNEFSMEFINSIRGNIRVKSAIFSEYVLQNLLNVDFLIKLIIEIIIKCEGTRGTISHFRDLQREIMRFSFIDRVFKRKRIGDRYKEIYEGIKHLPSMARNPHFWLQYAIARMESNAYPAAEIHFRTAYSFASKGKFDGANQIDNHYARFLIESRIFDPTYLDDFKAFLDAHNLLINQARKEKDAYYPYKVARSYRRFFETRGSKYSSSQADTVKRAAEEFLAESMKISKSAGKYYVIQECRDELNELLRILKTHKPMM